MVSQQFVLEIFLGIEDYLRAGCGMVSKQSRDFLGIEDYLRAGCGMVT